jgi:hypothetical protein
MSNYLRIQNQRHQDDEAHRTENEKKIQGLLNLRNAIERNKVSCLNTMDVLKQC